MPINREEIVRAIQDKILVIKPFDGRRVRSVSYVLSLGRRFRRWRRLNEPIVLWSSCAASEHLEDPEEADRLALKPGEFILGCTHEKLVIPANMVGHISAISHVARFGLEVCGDANLVNPGFGTSEPSALTLELCNRNPSPLILEVGAPLVHLQLELITESSEQAVQNSIYEGADPVVAPLLFEEWQVPVSDGHD